MGNASRMILTKKVLKRFGKGFTLVELIVVITILAILATIGFLALSGYAQDARDSAIKANVRSVMTAITSESVVTWNSPRYYVVHDSGAALSGAFVFVDGVQTALSGGNWGTAGTNYTAGNPDYVKLKLNPEKFKVSLRSSVETAFATYDSKYLSVGALDWTSSVMANGRIRTGTWFQVAGVVPSTGKAAVTGNFPAPSISESASGGVSGLVRDPLLSTTWAVVDGAITGSDANVSAGTTQSDRYPGCDGADIILWNGQIWAACNVGAATAYVSQSLTLANSTAAGGPTLAQKAYMGGYYQWGRNDDVTTGNVTTTRAPVGTLAGWVGHSDFIKNSTNPYDWLQTWQNDNLWGGSLTSGTSGSFTWQTAGNQSLMKGPCATGYHVPTGYEWTSAVSYVTGFAITATVTNQAKRDLWVNTLKLPMAGDRASAGWNYSDQWTSGYYWASSPSGIYGFSMYFTSSTAYPVGIAYRTDGISVRCMKN